ncbi:Metallophosphoesterase domain-containing protein 1 [Seminavis robusta]|uniref:Metallophosphoesterase domain-containing protein 1 n=1 Tax=Seminavis robusta TaxID=568900 RepID=A0A9N8HAC3_9STRA|nr:Metallophosphoesterase domain-containing protein 1 [Seminavis robusta]|eukprot:Sro143_g066520.1 Metallophosphoesterase domain-containing protein 1 (380) ;mRNA; f:29927-31162
MFLAKLHNRALLRMQTLSSVRKQLLSNNDLSPPTTTSNFVLEGAMSHSLQPHGSSRIVCMSDTHGKHADIPFLPHGDVLIHAGDFTKIGETDAVHDLSRYFQQQQQDSGFQEVVCIAGNHDITFHPDYYEKTWSRHIRSFDPFETREALQHCTYLEDSSARILNDKISVYGSPWTPSFFQWAFNLERGEALGKVWGRIPNDTDVLVTHGPPQGRQDVTLHSGNFGCQDLLQEIQDRVKPRLHIFGHIHEGYGVSYDGHTLYVNASNLDIGYEAINPCIVIDLPHDKTQPAMVVEPQQWIHDMEDFLFWLKQNNYRVIANAIEEAKPKELSLLSDNNPNLYSGHTYQNLCDQVGLKRRKHRPAKLELQTALCQLYAESFF